MQLFISSSFSRGLSSIYSLLFLKFERVATPVPPPPSRSANGIQVNFPRGEEFGNNYNEKENNYWFVGFISTRSNPYHLSIQRCSRLQYVAVCCMFFHARLQNIWLSTELWSNLHSNLFAFRQKDCHTQNVWLEICFTGGFI